MLLNNRGKSHLMEERESIFIFFRQPPTGSLVSPLQTVETSFLLINTGRYPHALVTCCSAIEAVIKRSPRFDKKNRRLQELLAWCRANSVALGKLTDSDLDRLRDARNDFVHHGFIPQDDHKAVALLLGVGHPPLRSCLFELHNFDLLDHLMQKYAEHLMISERVYAVARFQTDRVSFCMGSFVHLVRWLLGENFLPKWALISILKDEEAGDNFETMRRQKQSLERHFGCYESFECPVCGEPNSAVAELDESELTSEKVTPLRMACVLCGFTVGESQGILSQILLQQQIVEKKSEILKDHGIQARSPTHRRKN